MIYKRKNRYLVCRFILTHIFTIIALLNINDNFFIILIIWFVTVFLFNFIQLFLKNLYKIEIQGDDVYLYFFEFFIKKREIYNCNSLMYSYKYEAGARGIKSMELRIYRDKQVLIKGIGRSLDGWTENMILEITEEFKRIGIKEIEW